MSREFRGQELVTFHLILSCLQCLRSQVLPPPKAQHLNFSKLQPSRVLRPSGVRKVHIDPTSGFLQRSPGTGGIFSPSSVTVSSYSRSRRECLSSAENRRRWGRSQFFFWWRSISEKDINSGGSEHLLSPHQLQISTLHFTQSSDLTSTDTETQDAKLPHFVLNLLSSFGFRIRCSSLSWTDQVWSWTIQDFHHLCHRPNWLQHSNNHFLWSREHSYYQPQWGQIQSVDFYKRRWFRWVDLSNS